MPHRLNVAAILVCLAAATACSSSSTEPTTPVVTEQPCTKLCGWWAGGVKPRQYIGNFIAERDPASMQNPTAHEYIGAHLYCCREYGSNYALEVSGNIPYAFPDSVHFYSPAASQQDYPHRWDGVFVTPDSIQGLNYTLPPSNVIIIDNQPVPFHFARIADSASAGAR